MLTEAIIYTDGSAGKSGDGGWGAIVATPTYGLELSGYADQTTNNRMEMVAAIEGMRALRDPHSVTLVSDSAYVINTLSHGWYKEWFAEDGLHRNGWRRPNIDLWRQLVDMYEYHVVTPIKVKGHSGHEHNERVDRLAVEARLGKLSTAEVIYGGTS